MYVLLFVPVQGKFRDRSNFYGNANYRRPVRATSFTVPRSFNSLQAHFCKVTLFVSSVQILRLKICVAESFRERNILFSKCPSCCWLSENARCSLSDIFALRKQRELIFQCYKCLRWDFAKQNGSCSEDFSEIITRKAFDSSRYLQTNHCVPLRIGRIEYSCLSHEPSLMALAPTSLL